MGTRLPKGSIGFAFLPSASLEQNFKIIRPLSPSKITRPMSNGLIADHRIKLFIDVRSGFSAKKTADQISSAIKVLIKK